MTPENVLDQVQAEIIQTGRDTRYRVGAYGFVLNGLEYYLAKVGEKRHVSGQELSRGLLDFACKQFGPIAPMVFEYWGIRATDDFGYIVYNLIAIGRMSKRDEDALEDFFNVVDIRKYFDEQDYFHLDPATVKSIRGA